MILIKLIILKFRAEWSDSTINFLDVAVSVKNGVTETDHPS